MNLYKRFLNATIVDFRKMSKEQQTKDIYMHKHIYFSWIVMDMFTSRFKKVEKILIGTYVLDIVLALVSLILKNDLLIIFPAVTIPIIVVFCIAKILIDTQLKKRHKAEDKKQFISKMEEKIANLSLLNFKVVSLKVWLELRRDDKEWYQYLRSEECNNYCYNTTWELAAYMQDSKVKILWLGVTDILNGEKFGHAVLTKNGYIYDSNQRRTYEFEAYMGCYQAELFKEFSIDEYNDEKNIEKTFEEFDVWCQERGIQSAIED